MSIIGKVLAAEPLYLVAAATVDDSANSDDIIDTNGYGNEFVIVQTVKFTDGIDPTIACKIQESHDGSTWVDIAGAEFPLLTFGVWQSSLLVRPTRRYFRHTRVVAGTSPMINLSVIVIPVSEPRRPQVVLHLPPGTHAEIR